MMKYIATQEIGKYKINDEVPEEQALLWNFMYLVKPCIPVKEEIKVEKVEVKPEPKIELKVKKK